MFILKRLKQKSHGRDYIPFYKKGPKTTYEEKVLIVKKLLEEKPDINSRLRVTKITGIQSNILDLIDKNKDVTTLPAKKKSGHNKWTRSLGMLSNKKYGR